MCKLFALIFFSLPILFVVLYAVNAAFFFDHLFVYFILVTLFTYVSFIIYIITQTFLVVKNDSKLNKLVIKLHKWAKVGFIPVIHITSAIAFIWVTLLFAITLTLFGYLVTTFLTENYDDELYALVTYVTRHSELETSQYKTLSSLSDRVSYLVRARNEDLSSEFFVSNVEEYVVEGADFTYRLKYKPEFNIETKSVTPVYEYALTVCTVANETKEKCAIGDISINKAAAFSLSQNEVIEDLLADSYTFGEDGESLHRIRLVTDKHTQDILVILKPNSSSFSYAHSSSGLNLNRYRNYDMLSQDAESVTFAFNIYRNSILESTGKITLKFDETLKRINEIYTQIDK